jgi:hypothetical protein
MPDEEVNVVAIWRDASVTAVHVSPATASITRGRQRQLTAAVSGLGNVPQGVVWSIVDSNTVVGTHISPNGLLTIARNQPFTTLTIRATSMFDNSVYGEARIRVTVDEDIWVVPEPLPRADDDDSDDEVIEAPPSVGGVEIDYVVRTGQVVISITVNESRRIIAASDEVVVVNLTSKPYSIVQLPTNIVGRFAEAELGLVIHFAYGTITLDAEALYSISNLVVTRFVTISLVEVVEVEDLLEAQQDVLEDKDVTIFQVRIHAGPRVISEIDGEVIISIIYVSEDPVYVWSLDEYGVLELLELLEFEYEIELEENEHLLIFVVPVSGYVVIGN